jgi:hypothetical protein
MGCGSILCHCGSAHSGPEFRVLHSRPLHVRARDWRALQCPSLPVQAFSRDGGAHNCMCSRILAKFRGILCCQGGPRVPLQLESQCHFSREVHDGICGGDSYHKVPRPALCLAAPPLVNSLLTLFCWVPSFTCAAGTYRTWRGM